MVLTVNAHLICGPTIRTKTSLRENDLENGGHMHVYSSRAGVDNPLRSNFYI